jgi:transcription elongation factor Elf1
MRSFHRGRLVRMTALLSGNSKKKINQCKKCGSMDTKVQLSKGEPARYFVQCAECGKKGQKELTEKEAITSWNSQ